MFEWNPATLTLAAIIAAPIAFGLVFLALAVAEGFWQAVRP